MYNKRFFSAFLIFLLLLTISLQFTNAKTRLVININGQKINQQFLQDRDEIKMGKSCFIFRNKKGKGYE